MTGAEPLFIDTNILVYASVVTVPEHHAAFKALRDARRAKRPLWISRQVIREFIVTCTRPQNFRQPLTPDGVVREARYLEENFQVADDTAAVTGRLLELMENFKIAGKQVHDANIVATMRAHAIPCLLTHNSKDFERFREIISIEGIDS